MRPALKNAALKNRAQRGYSCAEKLKVIADGTRLSTLRLLMRGPLHVGEMTEVLGIDQSLLSHHLRILREAGLVRAERDGKAVLYSLSGDIEADPLPRSILSKSIDLGCCSLSFE
jgi:ArsR family transcriptional regulator